MNEKQSEFDNSINLEDELIKNEDNISVSEMHVENAIDKPVEKLIISEKNYSGIVINILK